MRGLLIVLTAIAMVAALCLGGCALVNIREYVTQKPGAVMYVDLRRTIAVASVFGLGLAVVLLATNGLVLYGLFRGTTPRRRLAVRGLAVFDVVAAAAALAWIVWADTWQWTEWPWTWLSKAAACLLAAKGVLIWRLMGPDRWPARDGDAAASDTRPA